MTIVIAEILFLGLSIWGSAITQVTDKEIKSISRTVLIASFITFNVVFFSNMKMGE